MAASAVEKASEDGGLVNISRQVDNNEWLFSSTSSGGNGNRADGKYSSRRREIILAEKDFVYFFFFDVRWWAVVGWWGIIRCVACSENTKFIARLFNLNAFRCEREIYAIDRFQNFFLANFEF